MGALHNSVVSLICWAIQGSCQLPNPILIAVASDEVEVDEVDVKEGGGMREICWRAWKEGTAVGKLAPAIVTIILPLTDTATGCTKDKVKFLRSSRG